VKRVKGILRPANILLIGEAPGTLEEQLGVPFAGAAGQELNSMLEDAGISRASCALTNVFDVRPPNNDLTPWCTPRRSAIATNQFFSLIPYNKLYIKPEHIQPARERLYHEIAQVKPNVIIALGNVAMSALTGTTGIGKTRGTLYLSTLQPTIKVIGTYHPSAILRQYELRAVTVADLMKAKAESAFPELRLRRRALYLEPTLDDLVQWRERLIAAPALAVDCETKAGQITCVGFSPSPDEAYVIPFWDRRKPGNHYWPDHASERFAWQVCHDILVSEAEKLLQNGMYDLQYFLHYRWPMRKFVHDTMIKHHSLYPGLPKGLDFLGSLYANERAWKKYRPRGGEEKREA
jgi:uracil-DNA glycosylase